jgi:medium-chain acyl-[acyl-carrier-protein] hydrolase
MARATRANNWFVLPKPNPAARLRLFCFPYAGGGAQAFWNWADHLPADVEVCLAQLPGRGARIRDAPYTRLLPLVETIAQAFGPYADRPFAFFGHSMGALIGFELARLLDAERRLGPVHLFASGCRAPQLPAADRQTYDWPEAEFVEDLRRLNGTPQQVLESAELMRLLMPLLRADFEAVQTYRYSAGQPLQCPITVCGGTQDKEVHREHLDGWLEQTSGAVTFRLFPGDHFFIHSSQPLLLRALKQDLERLPKTLSGATFQ